MLLCFDQQQLAVSRRRDDSDNTALVTWAKHHTVSSSDYTGTRTRLLLFGHKDLTQRVVVLPHTLAVPQMLDQNDAALRG